MDGVYEVIEGKWSVDIVVHAVWALSETSLQFRHRLLGFVNEWSAPDDSGRIRFSSLPPGWYGVQVQVHSPLAGWGTVAEVATSACEARVGGSGYARVGSHDPAASSTAWPKRIMRSNNVFMNGRSNSSVPARSSTGPTGI